MPGTISELLEIWLAPPAAGARPLGRPVSPHWHRTRRGLAKHLAAAIGETDVDELGPPAIWAVQRYCMARGLSAETTNKTTHHLLPAMLRDLEEAGLLAPGTRDRAMSRAAKLRAQGERVCQALTIEERDAVLRAFRRHWALPLVSFLFFTGVRIGEAAGLRQRDIDWSRQTVRVMRSRRGEEISATKSRRSQRVLKVPHAAIAALVGLRDDQHPEGWVFRGANGGPLNVDSFRCRTWAPMLKRNRIRPIRIHDARHTFVTIALELGKQAAEVAAFVGDKQSTVEERYSHVRIGDGWDAAVSAPAPLQRVRSAG